MIWSEHFSEREITRYLLGFATVHSLFYTGISNNVGEGMLYE